ncbi:MAG: hypothetical protein HY319_29770 [Armatimonadetes bacterium]|nr:hypothetical protein [Armatimonadota bacterium]
MHGHAVYRDGLNQAERRNLELLARLAELEQLLEMTGFEALEWEKRARRAESGLEHHRRCTALLATGPRWVSHALIQG